MVKECHILKSSSINSNLLQILIEGKEEEDQWKYDEKVQHNLRSSPSKQEQNCRRGRTGLV